MYLGYRRLLVPVGLSMAVVLSASTLPAASPTAEQALKLQPIQKGVDYVQATKEAAGKCKIAARKVGGQVGWIVEDGQGMVLRMFFDSNGDNVVDRWSYFKDGLEVYRDIDANFNGKADQYRWFHTGGSRWGLDKNEDGKIDQWKSISAEEVTAEVITALATRNASRFARLVLRSDELKSLGLGKARTERIAERIARISKQFDTLAARQKAVPADARWIQFSGSRPGIVPAGTDGSTRDVRVYENVVAIIEAGGKHSQVPIGTLVQIGDVWRVIDLPGAMTKTAGNSTGSGFFFQASLARSIAPTGSGAGEEGQRLLAELEKLDQSAEKAATAEQKAKYNARRADLLEQLAAKAAGSQERAMWLKQLADMVSAAVQSGTYPDGAKRLAGLVEKMKKGNADKSLVPYVKFRQLTAAYGLALQAPKPDFAKIQTDWLKSLEQYARDYPASPDAAEAMLQLAIAKEFAGQEKDAKLWYGRVAKGFPNSPAAKKAVGARTRLDSIGKQISMSGRGLSGKSIDLARYRGRVVLIQYWATWCEPAKTDMPVIKELLSKYKKSFSVIGVSLDGSRKDLTAFLAENRLPWPQIFEEGGLDSRPANQLGILTLPTMILVDKDGKVVNRNIQTTELAGALKKLMR